jgi:hypothetical protein
MINLNINKEGITAEGKELVVSYKRCGLVTERELVVDIWRP